MIENCQQLQQAIRQLERMYQALAELQARVRPMSSQWYRLMSEGPAEEIQRLQSDIETYFGLPVADRGSRELGDPEREFDVDDPELVPDAARHSRTQDELRALQERLEQLHERLQQTHPGSQNGLRLLIARLHEELAVYDGGRMEGRNSS